MDNYTLLEQSGVAGEMAGLLERYPWFTLARYMQLRALRIIDPNGYRRALRQADVRLFGHPYPRILLSDELGQEAVPAFLPPKEEPSAEQDRGEFPVAVYVADTDMGPSAQQAQQAQQADATVSAIDNFLNHDFSGSRITPPPEEFYQEDISVESVTEHGEAISETLAGIYVSQGRYDKACDIYYRLSLKYPEKSVYFADLIAHLQLCTSSSSY